MDLLTKRVLLTGAGSGIGRQTAFAFARRGAELWLSDLQLDGLERTALLCRALGANTHMRVVDVADYSQMSAWAAEVHDHGGALDVLINNAGVGVAGELIETDPNVWDWALGINVKGVAYGCRLFAPAMIERGCGGHIVNVASSAGLLAPSSMSVYAASKFAVVGLSESLRAELHKDRVEVTALCPGVVNTPIVRNTRLTGSLAQRAGFTERVASLYQRRGYGPERVASVIVAAVESRRGGVLPVTPEAWGMYFAKRWAPELVHRVVARSKYTL